MGSPSQLLLPTFLFESTSIVNVSSVAQRSPFRYPGGKTWLVPDVIRWLRQRPKRTKHFYEIFAGGAIVGLTMVFNRLFEAVTLVEIDKDVSAVWKVALSKDSEWLIRRILDFDLTATTAQALLEARPKSIRERAFTTIVRNRINHGGILAPGSGILKYGENGKGIRSRWYPETLARRLRNIREVSSRISFLEADGIDLLAESVDDPDITFFMDPPYTAGGKRAGRRLYAHNAVNHERLFELASQVKGDCLLTYDFAKEPAELAQKYGLDTSVVAMKNRHHATLRELFISKRV